MRKFDYYEPRSLAEATALLSNLGDGARVMAGGTDLLNQMKRDEVCPKSLINIKGISGLDYVELVGSRPLRIGALARIRDLAANENLRRDYPAISEAARCMATPSIRNLATIGGNVCHASPAADMAPSLIAYSAQVRIAGQGGDRVLPIDDFFVGPGQTALGEGEILVEIEVPVPPSGGRSTYLKHSIRRTNDTTIVGVAAFIALDDQSGTITAAGLALGSVSPTPMRARAAEAALLGQKPELALIEEVASIAARECQPISDVRGTSAYRAEMVRVFTRRAVKALL